ncbi:AI-2E family transporter [Clostridium sp. CTA-19]
MNKFKDLKEKFNANLYILLIILCAYIGVKIIDNYYILFNLYDLLLGILWPFILAAIIAYVLNPIMKVFENKLNLSRGISLLSTLILVTLVLVLCAIYLVPGIVSNITTLINSIPEMVRISEKWFNNAINSELTMEIANKINILENLGNWSTTFFNTALASLVTVTLSIVNWVFALIIAVYYLFYKETFVKSSRKWLFIIFRERLGKKLLEFFHAVNYMLGTYLWVRAVESTIVGIACFIGLIFIKSQYIVLISVVFGITNMVPYFGPFVGIVFGVVLNIFFNPMTALIVLIWLFVLQQIDGNWLGPKMSSNSIGINPVACLLALSVGGKLYGMIGMLIAIPIAGALKIYYERYLNKYTSKNPKLVDAIDNYKVDISHIKVKKNSSIKSSSNRKDNNSNN